MEGEETGGFWSSYENGFTRWLERLQGNLPAEEQAAAEAALDQARAAAAEAGQEFVEPTRGVIGAAWDGLLWFVSNLIEAAYNILFAVTHPGMWLDWSDKEAIARVIYYGGSRELFFAFLLIVLILTAIGLARNRFMWGMVIGLEGFANTVGRLFAWAGLIMVIQQILIVFMQRIFVSAQITIGIGKAVTFDISWWAEALKLHNALVVALCLTFTFVQGGHVRVDLIYSAVKFRTKRVIDMIGSIIFMAPFGILIWVFGWYYLWRHLVTPNPNAFNTIERQMQQARALRWNVETIGFSPNGFNAYFLFKILMVAMAGMIILHSVAFFCRSYLEWKEGPESEGKHLDKDVLGDEVADAAADAH